jgi:integrase
MRTIRRYKYVNEYPDRHGKVRRYLRFPGRPGIVLPGEPGSPEFDEAYRAGLAALKINQVGKDRAVLGTIGAAIGSYYTDNKFLSLAPTTRQNRRMILERFRKHHGDKPLRLLERKHLAAVCGQLNPFAARDLLKALRHMMQYAVTIELIATDPTAGLEPVELPKSDKEEKGYHTWTEEEIAQFEATHAIGSQARLAFALLLFTAQRRKDVIRMGPQHIRNNKLSRISQSKTKAPIDIPVHPQLTAILAASEIGNLNFLVTNQGAPFSDTKFGQHFRRWCTEANLTGCSPHGLRKAACRRLAEAGCSAPEIAAISGHKSLKEVQRYIAAADQARLAEAGFARLTERAANEKVTNLSEKTY